MPKITKVASRRKRKATLEKTITNVAQEVDLKPLNRQQDAAIKTIEKSHITFLTGPAGTGKTYVACGFAVKEVASGSAEQIIVTRPIVEAGESLGFLPGTLMEKVNPYLLPLFDSITKLAGKTGKRRDEINASLVIAPLAYMRGRTFDNAIVVVDEAQNCTEEQLRLVITRLGKNSKIILAGDISQSDLKKTERALYRVIAKLSHVNGVGVYRFSAASIVRHPVLAAVLEAWK